MSIIERLDEIQQHQDAVAKLMREIILELATTVEVCWVPISEYAKENHCSTATVARRVKAGKLTQEGRFILVEVKRTIGRGESL